MINLIAAVGYSGQIGMDGDLPWHDPEDLAWFKSMTMNGIVIVGGVTKKNLPPLPGRIVIGWGRDIAPDSMLESIKMTTGKHIWIAGGARTYKAFMPYVQRVYISRIDYDGPADTFMPDLWFQPTGGRDD